MKIRSKREKWAVGILGVLCAALLVNLAMQTGVKAGAPHPLKSTPAPAIPTPKAASPKAAMSADGPAYDSSLQLELLERLQSRPLEASDRNPFEFGLTPAQQAAKLEQQRIKAQPSAPAAPPIPPITVKALGFTEDKSGKRKAILADEEQTYQVLEGGSFAGRYKCLKITADAVQIQDESYHQTVQLPFPQ